VGVDATAEAEGRRMRRGEVLREENGGFETVEEKEKQTRWKM
jgi:hypothetical protein